MNLRALFVLVWAVFAVGALSCSEAQATTVKELARLSGQGQSILRGVGLVVGLPGTGDSGKELVVARPLAKLIDNGGIELGSPLELKNSRSVALVSVTCIISSSGAMADDTFDVTVSVLNSASSLRGGELYLTVLRGPFPDSPPYAIAQGQIDLEDALTPTSGRVRSGARMIRDILMPEVGDEFEIIVDSAFAGWGAVSQIATAINAKAQPQGPEVAFAITERVIRVSIPASERKDRAGFLSDVLSADVNVALLDLPAQVIINQRTGAIILPVDVSISPVAITHRGLTITTVTPSPIATQQNPLIARADWASIKMGARPSEAAKLSDLVAAFEQLDVPVEDQIGIIQMLHKSGQLKAKLLID